MTINISLVMRDSVVLCFETNESFDALRNKVSYAVNNKYSFTITDSKTKETVYINPMHIMYYNISENGKSK